MQLVVMHGPVEEIVQASYGAWAASGDHPRNWSDILWDGIDGDIFLFKVAKRYDWADDGRRAVASYEHLLYA